MIYFVQCNNTDQFIKIGSTTENVSQPRLQLPYTVKARIDVLQSGNPYPLVLLAVIVGGATLERDLHQQFAHARVRGEWFKPVPALLDYIAQHID